MILALSGEKGKQIELHIANFSVSGQWFTRRMKPKTFEPYFLGEGGLVGAVAKPMRLGEEGIGSISWRRASKTTLN